jgi:hypothetical protein
MALSPGSFPLAVKRDVNDRWVVVGLSSFTVLCYVAFFAFRFNRGFQRPETA